MKTSKQISTSLRKAVMTLAVLSNCLASLAQTSDPFNYYSNISPSAETFQMEKYGRLSHSLYTGAMASSVPVYTYTDPDFTFPITLDYTYDGYKPTLHSGSVGFGWSLGMGGSITREIRGMADDLYDMENNNYGYFRTVEVGFVPDSAIVVSNSISVPYYYEPLVASPIALCLLTDTPAYAQDVCSYDCHYDTEPDMFHINLPGLKADFIMGEDGRFHVVSSNQPFGEITVGYEYSNSPICSDIHTSSFVITTGDGVRYRFGGSISSCEYDYASNCSTGGGRIMSTRDGVYTLSSWRLVGIEAPNGRTLDITYRERQQMDISIFKTYTPELLFSGRTGQESNSSFSNVPSCIKWSSSCCFRSLPQSIRVDGVCMAEFSYSRKTKPENTSSAIMRYDYNSIEDFRPLGFDVEDELMLNSISIKNGDGTIIARSTLSQYFTRDNSGPAKMFLSTITSNDGSQYTFHYNCDMNTQFPQIDRDCTDHWGYWNGNTTDYDLRDYIVSADPSIVDISHQLSTDMRDAVFSYSSKGALTRIDYPTGGYSTIEYGSHSASKILLRSFGRFPYLENNPDNIVPGGIRVTRISDIAEDFSLTREYRYHDGIINRFPRYAASVEYSYGAVNNDAPGQRIRAAVTAFSMDVSMGLMKDNHITYGRVEEVYTCGGMIEYEFSDWGTMPDDYSTGQLSIKKISERFALIESDDYIEGMARMGTAPTCDYSGLRGLLLSKKYYRGDEQYILEEQTDYIYNGRQTYSQQLVTNAVIATSLVSRRYLSKELASETAKRFYPTPMEDRYGAMGTQTRYSYNSLGQKIREESFSLLSNTVEYRTDYSYVYTGGSYDYRFKGRLNSVTQSHIEDGHNSVTSAVRYYYASPSNPSPTYIHAQRGDCSEFMDITYNAQFRPVRISRNGGMYISYSWDATGRYPLSRTVNGLEDTTTYEWFDMVGLSKVVHPSGVEEEYGYDSCGRPLYVKGPDDEYLSGWEYFIGQGSHIKTHTYTGDDNEHFTDIEWYNGLGMMNQRTMVEASPLGEKDIIIPVTYDSLGRPDEIVHLPYAFEGNGNFDTQSIQHKNAFYDTLFPGEGRLSYSVSSRMDESLLDRIQSLQKPGMAYSSSSRRVEYEYRLNDDIGDGILKLSMDPATDISACMTVTVSEDPWMSGTLLVTTCTDEDGNVKKSFTDAYGKLICEEVAGAQTYYVYNQSDSLACVFQPEGSARLGCGECYTVSGNGMDELAELYCFSWKYDGSGRLLESHTPSGGYTVNVTDERGNVILSSDSELRAHGRWMYFIYDAYNRIVEKGLCSLDMDPYELREFISDGDPWEDYISDRTVLHTCSYYPCSSANTGFRMSLASERVFSSPDFDSLTGGSVDRGHVDRTYSYDYRGRVTQIQETDSDGWHALFTTQYDFCNNPIITVERHWNAALGLDDTKTRRLTYDSRERLSSLSTYMNGELVNTQNYNYDALGLLSGMTLQDNTGGRTVEERYTRNIQGWQTGRAVSYNTTDEILDPMFEETIRYYDAAHGENLYAGNISESASRNGFAASENLYAYSYDNTGKLTASRHFVGGIEIQTDRETGMTYDANGNMTGIRRYGHRSGDLSCLTFSHWGNQLTDVSDSLTDSSYEYYYDANGNLISDGWGDLEISYNILNLPCSISSNQDMGELSYRYLSDGAKLSCESFGDGGIPQSGKYYRGSFVYLGAENASGDYEESLDYVTTDSGLLRFTPEDDEIPLHDIYFVKDHLGSVRQVVDLSLQSDLDPLLEINDYLPYGTRVDSGASSLTDQENTYRFAGKEEQKSSSFDSGLLDFGARYYSPYTCRWTTPDPMATQSTSEGIYNYCVNNPPCYIDMYGRDTVYVLDQSARPLDNYKEGTTYTATIIVIQNGEVSGEYRGSSYPNSVSIKDNSPASNTLSEGSHSYTNMYGHTPPSTGITEKGLNIDDSDNGARTTTGIDPKGNKVVMNHVNIHKGYSDRGGPASRGSHGCITIHPDDQAAFFSNFSWSPNDSGVRGTSNGTVFVYRNLIEPAYCYSNK